MIENKGKLFYMKKKKLILTILGIISLAIAFTFLFYNYALNITQVIRVNPGDAVSDSTTRKKPVVFISVISRYPPNIIYRGYQPILDYLTSKTDYRFELKLSSDYNEAVNMLINKEVSAAFLGSYVYVKAHKEHGVIPILKPLNENFVPFSRSVLFSKSSDGVYNIGDLKHKKLALPSIESFSSNWLLQYEFPKNNIHQKDLAEITNFPHHQSVILNVVKGKYDVGVTREYLIKKIHDGSIRIILYSEPLPTSPIVVAADYQKTVIDALKKTLLEINQFNPDREKITKEWDAEFINGFVEARDEDYNFVRLISK
ncbi:MAG: phosphate/phosphite/phosphonate ABC transporter substrate-binding protein [Ignavibacteria bacterium]|nr:phosphate/phosphite/phosphonate ABC transporter substrate-binding protein [Ignavibacteria bacterium]